MIKQDQHIQFTIEGRDYGLILRVDDEGTDFVSFDIFDYVAQEYKANGIIRND